MIESGDERGKWDKKGAREGHFSWGNGEMAENGTSDDSDEENGRKGGRDIKWTDPPTWCIPESKWAARRMFSSVECTNVGFSCTIAHLTMKM